MERGFIKLSRDALEIATEDPQVFLLLTQIALRARRIDTILNKHNLKVGEALIGDLQSLGFSRQTYRSTKARAEKYGFATFKPTTKGTIARLTDTRIYDINLCEGNRQSNRQSNRRVTDDENFPVISEGDIQTDTKKNERREKNTSYSIAQTTSSPRSTDELMFNFSLNSFVGITDKDREDWLIAYPCIKLGQELSRATQWVIANPTKAKSKKLWRKFLNTWLSKANEHEANRGAYSIASKPKDHRQQLNQDGTSDRQYAELF